MKTPLIDWTMCVYIYIYSLFFLLNYMHFYRDILSGVISALN